MEERVGYRLLEKHLQTVELPDWFRMDLRGNNNLPTDHYRRTAVLSKALYGQRHHG